MRFEKKYILYIAIAVLLLAIPLIAPNNYIMHIVNLIGIYAILGMGFNVLGGYLGQMSLGQAGFWAVGAYASALLNTAVGAPVVVSMLFGIVIAALLGVILAIPALNMKGKYLVLLTMGFGEIVRMVILNWGSLTNGANGITRIGVLNLFGYQVKSLGQFYYVILIMVILVFLFQKALVTSKTGRAFISIREDEQAAELSGIPVAKYKIKGYAISAAISGLAGVLYAHSIRYISPTTFPYAESTAILSMAIVGGLGTLWGPICGSIFLNVISELLRDAGEFRMIVYGCMLVITVLFFPGGLVRSYGRLKDKMRNRKGGEKNVSSGT